MRRAINSSGQNVAIADDGDTVDDIAFQEFGPYRGYPEKIYNLNPGLADIGIFLPAGTVVVLPEEETSSPQKATINLWD